MSAKPTNCLLNKFVRFFFLKLSQGIYFALIKKIAAENAINEGPATIFSIIAITKNRFYKIYCKYFIKSACIQMIGYMKMQKHHSKNSCASQHINPIISGNNILIN